MAKLRVKYAIKVQEEGKHEVDFKPPQKTLLLAPSPTGWRQQVSLQPTDHSNSRPLEPPSHMRVIFVDFDGVLHATHGRGAIMREYVWLPILMELISGYSDVRVVVHASARRNTSPDFLNGRLRIPERTWMGVTPARLERWPSIQVWLESQPGVEAFLILDDQLSEFPTPPPAELIVCDAEKGLSEPRVQAAVIAWLAATDQVTH